MAHQVTQSYKRHLTRQVKQVLPVGWWIRLSIRRNTIVCSVFRGRQNLGAILKDPSNPNVNPYWVSEYVQEPYVTVVEDMVTALRDKGGHYVRITFRNYSVDTSTPIR